MKTKLKTVTVTLQYVIAVDEDYKSDFTTARHAFDEAVTDMGFPGDAQIEDYVVGDAEYTDDSLPYGYENGYVCKRTIGEIKND
mgnify:FL=1